MTGRVFKGGGAAGGGLPPGAAGGVGSGFERLGPVGCADCSVFTSGLLTWWSSTALDETWF